MTVTESWSSRNATQSANCRKAVSCRQRLLHRPSALQGRITVPAELFDPSDRRPAVRRPRRVGGTGRGSPYGLTSACPSHSLFQLQYTCINLEIGGSVLMSSLGSTLMSLDTEAKATVSPDIQPKHFHCGTGLLLRFPVRYSRHI